MWSDKGYTADSLQDRAVQLYLGSALANAYWAVEQFRMLPENLIQRDKCQTQFIRAKANYIYFLATKKARKEEALQLAQELQESERKLTNDQRECIAWCYLRFSEPRQEEWIEGLTLLAHVMNTTKLSPSIRETRQKRYIGLFGEDPEMINALHGIAPSRDRPVSGTQLSTQAPNP